MLDGKRPPAPDEADPAFHRLMVRGALDVLVLLSPDLRRLYVSPACLEVMGYSSGELLGGRADSLVHEDDLGHVNSTMAGLCEARPVAQAAWRMRRRDGSHRWMETRYRRLPDGHVVTGIRDIQDRKEIEGQLQAALDRVERIAMIDQLTALPNRRWFIEQVDRRLMAGGGGRGYALMIVDLNGFKAINDRYGHPTGDTVLAEVGRRLEASMPGQLVARLGGDEFAVLAGLDGPDAIATVAARLVAAVAEPIQCGIRSVETGVSVGIAVFPRDGSDYRVLMTHADAAMYGVKRSSARGGFSFYDPAVDNRSLRAAALERGLSSGEVVPFYQPLVSLDDGLIVGFEALARWIHPVEGFLMPERFLPLIREYGLHDDLFTAIVRQAARDAAGWPGTARLCVNVSPAQFCDRAFPARVAALLAETGLSPSGVTLEMTESEPISEWAVAREVMDALRGRGFTIVLDDFGTGHSGLTTLQQLRFDGLKVDRSFILPAATGQCPVRYFAAIVELGLRLGLEVTAEGIETQEGARIARSLGCAIGQGFLYGPAVSGDAVRALLSTGPAA